MMHCAKTVNEQRITVAAGKFAQVCAPRGEQWFSVVMYGSDGKPTSGSLTIGDMVNVSGQLHYPMTGYGFITVPFTAIPNKLAYNETELASVASFFGQSSSGFFGVNNSTDASITLVITTALHTVGVVQ